MRYETREVLADAYHGRDLPGRPMLSHAVALSDQGVIREVLCGRVKFENVADAGAQDVTLPPTCPRCFRRLQKLTRALEVEA